MKITELQPNGLGMPTDGIIPDIPQVPNMQADTDTGNAPIAQGGLVDFGGLVSSFQNASRALDSAGSAEARFARGQGNLLEMALERAKADTLLSVASATFSKTTQAATTLMNIQV